MSEADTILESVSLQENKTKNDLIKDILFYLPSLEVAKGYFYRASLKELSEVLNDIKSLTINK